MDLKDLQNLIEFVAKSEVSGVKYKTKDFEIQITNPSSHHSETPLVHHIPVAASSVANNAEAKPVNNMVEKEENSNLLTIKSPIIGTFYRKPSPDKPAFVEVGSEVKEGSIVCVVEAMKLFNQIESEVSGRIVKILVDDASPVEYDQPLFLVEPF